MAVRHVVWLVIWMLAAITVAFLTAMAAGLL
jgi:hypothetical protein